MFSTQPWHQCRALCGCRPVRCMPSFSPHPTASSSCTHHPNPRKRRETRCVRGGGCGHLRDRPPSRNVHILSPQNNSKAPKFCINSLKQTPRYATSSLIYNPTPSFDSQKNRRFSNGVYFPIRSCPSPSSHYLNRIYYRHPIFEFKLSIFLLGAGFWPQWWRSTTRPSGISLGVAFPASVSRAFLEAEG